jgi:hypothetical protein
MERELIERHRPNQLRVIVSASSENQKIVFSVQLPAAGRLVEYGGAVSPKEAFSFSLIVFALWPLECQ